MNFDSAEQVIDSVVNDAEPSVSIGIYRDGELIRAYSRGLGSVEFAVPATSTTRYDIASISKQFTAATVLLLDAEGIIDMKRDIREYLPELALTTPVTLAQCLQHTGGLMEWYSLVTVTGTPFTELSEARLLGLLAGIRHTNFDPGSDFSYSNTGYVLVAAAVRRVTGRSLADVAADRVFGPLGMESTLFRDDTSVPIPDFAPGYANADGATRRADTEESAVGDGGIVTNLTDLAAWFGFLEDGRVLGRTLRDRLLERAVLLDGTVIPYAYGIYHSTVAGASAFGHAGGVGGYLSNLVLLPDHGLGVAVLSNQTRVAPIELSTSVVEALLDYRAEEQGPAPAPSNAGDPSGSWLDPRTDQTIEITATESGLRLRSAGEDHEFIATGTGDWNGIGDVDGLMLGLRTSEELVLSSTHSVRRPIRFERCRPAGTITVADGIYWNEELNVLARISDEEIALGLSLKLPLAPAPAGLTAAGPLTVRPTDHGIELSTSGMHRLSFRHMPDGTRPIGVPNGFDATH